MKNLKPVRGARTKEEFEEQQLSKLKESLLKENREDYSQFADLPPREFYEKVIEYEKKLLEELEKAKKELKRFKITL